LEYTWRLNSMSIASVSAFTNYSLTELRTVSGIFRGYS